MLPLLKAPDHLIHLFSSHQFLSMEGLYNKSNSKIYLLHIPMQSHENTHLPLDWSHSISLNYDISTFVNAPGTNCQLKIVPSIALVIAYWDCLSNWMCITACVFPFKRPTFWKSSLPPPYALNTTMSLWHVITRKRPSGVKLTQWTGYCLFRSNSFRHSNWK